MMIENNYADRWLNCLVLGAIADDLFAQECRRLGIHPDVALRAPLDWLTSTHITGRTVH